MNAYKQVAYDRAITDVEFELAKLQKENNENVARIKELESHVTHISKSLTNKEYMAT
jgi:hypothetical protein